MEDLVLSFITWAMDVLAGSTEAAKSILCVNLRSNEHIWAFVESTQAIVRPVSYSVLLIFFMIKIIKTGMKLTDVRWEDIFKHLIEFTLMKALIDNLQRLLEAIYNTCAGWINRLTIGNPDMYDQIATALEEALDGSFWLALVTLVLGLIPVLILLVCSLVVKVMAYGRLVEIYILLAIMPIPTAFAMESEGNFNITRGFIFNFMAVCLQGFLMVVAVSLYQYLMADQFAADVEGEGMALIMGLLLKLVVGAIVMVMAVVKAGGTSKSILKAH